MAVFACRIVDTVFSEGPVSVHMPSGSTLLLPPKPRAMFKNRLRGEHGSRANLDEFLRETWGDYCENYLLYTEWLRHIDPSLYKALINRVSRGEVSFPEYCLEHGILTKHHMRNPPPGLERQVRAIRIAMVKTQVMESES